jgi:hypothetical protein
MERYCSTSQSPQRAVAPTEEEEEEEEEEDQILTILNEFVKYFRKIGIKYDRSSNIWTLREPIIWLGRRFLYHS